MQRPGGGIHRLHEGLCRADPPVHPKGRSYKVLGTDGFGRSDFRSKLREHFEVNRHYIVVAALKALSDDGTVPAAKVAEAIAKYGIKADKINPLYA
jgi:pyruvate dehydrogenase E1 component